MPDKYQQKRIASWFEMATFGVQSFDLVATEAERKGETSWLYARCRLVGTLRALDTICRAKRSALLSPEQLALLDSLHADIAKITGCADRLAQLGLRLKPSIVAEVGV
jgi:NAD-dependent DNA ligase